MDRRNFFKIVSTVSAGAATTACSSNKTDALIPLLVPEHEIPPGEERWHPSLCGECAAGCGVIVRVMEGERTIERDGQKFRQRIACVKKIEGNPLDPVSGGRLCARGHAALQSLYNPDRLRGPMRRTGPRGKAQFEAISWDNALSQVAEKLTKAHTANPKGIVFLTSAVKGSRTTAIQHFLESLGAPVAVSCSVADLDIEREAARQVFGWNGVPHYDLGNARYVLGVGADFLGGWASPVYYARQFGHFRQGRPGLRGKLVQAESRMSLTAGSADEWLPLQPGSEPHLLAAVGHLLLSEKLARHADLLPPGVSDALTAANFPDLLKRTGISEKRVRRIATELAQSDAPLVIGGASIVHTNSLDALIASHYLNLMLGNVGKPGGLLPPNGAFGQKTDSAVTGKGDLASLLVPAKGDLASLLKNAQLVFLDRENPIYNSPAASGLSKLLGNVDTVVSFGGFIDDSAAYADLILPDHSTFESDSVAAPAVAATSIALTIAAPVVRPLHDTRPIEQTLADLAKRVNVQFTAVTSQALVQPLLADNETWEGVTRSGGLWHDSVAAPASVPKGATLAWRDPAFAGPSETFTLHFQPYPSLQYQDGRGANLPWMQELPDPASSAMWGLPVEIDPGTASKLKVATGDRVRVESAHGSLEAAAYVHPAALPGVVSMAIGQGHSTYGRYASGRGANPLSIVAPTFENATGALAFGGTLVRVTRLDNKPGELIQFSPQDREQGPWGHR